jgi:predicted HAD superfamily hydrolase
MNRELLQQALDALEKHVYEYETIQALHTRLAQPEDKPNKLINVNGVLEQAGYVKKKEWVGLTDKEMFDCLVQTDYAAVRLPLGLKLFAEFIEAKLKEKNT